MQIRSIAKENRKVNQFCCLILRYLLGEKYNRVGTSILSHEQKSNKNEEMDKHFSILQKHWA